MSLASLRLFQAPSTFFVNQKLIRFKKISMLRSSISRLNKPLTIKLIAKLSQVDLALRTLQ